MHDVRGIVLYVVVLVPGVWYGPVPVVYEDTPSDTSWWNHMVGCIGQEIFVHSDSGGG